MQIRETQQDLKRKQRAAYAVFEKKRRVEKRLLEVAYTLLVQDAPESATCQAFLAQHSTHLVSRSPEEAVGVLEQQLLDAPLHDLQQIMAGSGGGIPAARFSAAKRWRCEKNIHAWVLEHNVHRAVAPTQHQVIRKRQQLLCEPLAHRETPMSVQPRSRRQWIAGFRRRWGLKMGSFQVRDEPTVEIKRHKVGLEFRAEMGPFLGQFRGPVLGEKWRHGMAKKGGHFPAGELGPPYYGLTMGPPRGPHFVCHFPAAFFGRPTSKKRGHSAVEVGGFPTPARPGRTPGALAELRRDVGEIRHGRCKRLALCIMVFSGPLPASRAEVSEEGAAVCFDTRWPHLR